MASDLIVVEVLSPSDYQAKIALNNRGKIMLWRKVSWDLKDRIVFHLATP